MEYGKKEKKRMNFIYICSEGFKRNLWTGQSFPHFLYNSIETFHKKIILLYVAFRSFRSDPLLQAGILKIKNCKVGKP
jgi:hypothetical protein